MIQQLSILLRLTGRYVAIPASVLVLALTGCFNSDDDDNNGGSSSSSSTSSSTSSSSTSSSSTSSSSTSSSGGLPVIEDKFFGTAPDLATDYDDLLTYFDQLTPGNAGKWGTVEGTQDTMNWTTLDTAYNFARDNDLLFKFHTLIWGQQQPGWMTDASLTNEQMLAEIEEWMTEIAARYPDLEMIDVVNEPLHAVPAYKDALGGDGVTGWDWVITAFEMAREHFPDAILILNDYQILHLEQFTEDYLEIITLLQDRGLIDGIGVQAHFLEQTQATMVQTNLDTLAATGLPIYVSEFDLDLADDARHANRIRDLFTVFWDHPRVAGITHWGHLQGNMWRTNGYLLLTDHSTRVGMDWVLCYMSGGAGCDALVPVYTPLGWQGDEYGVTLEAELYDEGEGLVALGGQVAYTNNGDWIKFSSVELQDGWDTLWVNYTKGNDDGYEASISIHLGDLTNAPLETVVLPPTGSWGTSDTIEVAWEPILATADVYIRFNADPASEAVANLDNIIIGRPRPVSEINLVTDGGFEGIAVDGGWGPFGNTSAFDLTTDQAHTGSQSMEVTGRTGTGGFASYWLTNRVSTGTTYAVSAEIFQAGAATDTVRLSAQVACTAPTTPVGHNEFPWLHDSTAEPNTWTTLSGQLVIPDGCDIATVQIFFEGPAEATIVYLDEVKVAPMNLVGDGGFEGVALDGGWSNFGSDTVLSLSAVEANNGVQSMLADRTTGTGGFAGYLLTDFMTPGLSYLASAQVYQTGAGDDTVRMIGLVKCDGEADDYQWIENNTAVPNNTWTQLSGAFSIPLDCDVTEVQLYFEGTAEGVDVYIDDVSVTLPATNLVTNGDFETDTSGWGIWYTGTTTLATSADQAFTGSQSLLASGRVANSHPSYNLTALVSADTSYTVSAQVMHAGLANDTLRLSGVVDCTDATDPPGHNTYPWINNVADVAPTTWTQLTGTLTVPAGCDIVEVRFYFEGTTLGVDLYIDDVSVTVN